MRGLHQDSEGWRAPPPAAIPADVCNIPVIDAAALNASGLSAYYSEPLLVKGGASTWAAQRRWRRDWMAQAWGRLEVRLAPSAASDSSALLQDFLREMQLQPNHLALGNLTAPPPRFVFQPLTWDWLAASRPGRERLTWAHVEADLRLPSFLSGWRLGAESEQLSERDLGNWFLSVGASGSGQHFHSHGEAFNAAVWGRKRWFFLMPGASAVDAGAYSSSLDFLRRLPADLPLVDGSARRLVECTQEKGDVLLVPAQVPHAVVNEGDTVSVSLDRV